MHSSTKVQKKYIYSEKDNNLQAGLCNYMSDPEEFRLEGHFSKVNIQRCNKTHVQNKAVNKHTACV